MSHELARTFRPVFPLCEITISHLEGEEWFAVREVARLEREVVHLSIFDVANHGSCCVSST